MQACIHLESIRRYYIAFYPGNCFHPTAHQASVMQTRLSNRFVSRNICIALKWWKLERLSVTGSWCYPAQMSCHDWQSPSKEERWRGTGIIRNAGRCYHQEIPKCDSNKVTATRPQATKNCMANSDKSIHSIELFWSCDPNSPTVWLHNSLLTCVLAPVEQPVTPP